MNEEAPLPSPEPARTRWWLWLAPILLSALIGLGRVGYAYRDGPRRHFRAGVAAFARDDLDGVQTACQAVRGVEGYEPHFRLLKGMILLRSGRLREAAGELVHATDNLDTRALACTLGGEALYHARQLRDAERVLNTAIQFDPSQTDARRWLAVLYYDVGSMVHALEQLKTVAEQAPDDARPHRLMGLIHKDAGLHQEAILAYRESLQRAPKQPAKQEIHLELAECLLKQRRHAELLETLRECTRSAQRLALEAESHYNEGDGVTARKLTAEALKLAPNHLDAMHLQATMDLESGDTASAVKILRRAAEWHPKEYRVRYKLAQAYLRLGQKKPAAEEAKASRELFDLLKRFNELQQKAIQETFNAETRYQLGVVAGQLGKPEHAESWFQAALALDPNHAGARRELDAMTQHASQRPQIKSEPP
jgi:tetratricopeptide (TPR) repeat protein